MVNIRITDRPINPLRYIFFGFYFFLILLNLIEYIRGKFTLRIIQKSNLLFDFRWIFSVYFHVQIQRLSHSGYRYLGYFTLVGTTLFMLSQIIKNKPPYKRVKK